jgi:hypothetical protein
VRWPCKVLSVTSASNKRTGTQHEHHAHRYRWHPADPADAGQRPGGALSTFPGELKRVRAAVAQGPCWSCPHFDICAYLSQTCSAWARAAAGKPWTDEQRAPSLFRVAPERWAAASARVEVLRGVVAGMVASRDRSVESHASVGSAAGFFGEPGINVPTDRIGRDERI